MGTVDDDTLEPPHRLNNTLTVVDLLQVDLDFELFCNPHNHIVHLLSELCFFALTLDVVDQLDCGCVLECPLLRTALAEGWSQVRGGELILCDRALALHHPGVAIGLSLRGERLAIIDRWHVDFLAGGFATGATPHNTASFVVKVAHFFHLAHHFLVCFQNGLVNLSFDALRVDHVIFKISHHGDFLLVVESKSSGTPLFVYFALDHGTEAFLQAVELDLELCFIDDSFLFGPSVSLIQVHLSILVLDVVLLTVGVQNCHDLELVQGIDYSILDGVLCELLLPEGSEFLVFEQLRKFESCAHILQTELLITTIFGSL